MGSDALWAAGEDGDHSVGQEEGLRSRNGWNERKFSAAAADLDFVQSKKKKKKITRGLTEASWAISSIPPLLTAVSISVWEREIMEMDFTKLRAIKMII